MGTSAIAPLLGYGCFAELASVRQYMDPFHSLKVGSKPGFGLISDVKITSQPKKKADFILQYENEDNGTEVKFGFKEKNSLDLESNFNLSKLIGLPWCSVGVSSVGPDRNLLGRCEFNNPVFGIELEAGIEEGKPTAPFTTGCAPPGLGLAMAVKGHLPFPGAGWTVHNLVEHIRMEWKQEKMLTVFGEYDFESNNATARCLVDMIPGVIFCAEVQSRERSGKVPRVSAGVEWKLNKQAKLKSVARYGRMKGDDESRPWLDVGLKTTSNNKCTFIVGSRLKSLSVRDLDIGFTLEIASNRLRFG